MIFKMSFFQNKTRGFSLIDVVVGTALALLVFSSIIAAYQAGLKVIGTSKARVIATAIANAELEKIRNMPYEDIGVVNSHPEGVLAATDEIISGGVTFSINRRVDYVADSADGIAQGDGDECPNDYKKAEISVLSSGRFEVDIFMVTNIPPKNLAQECADDGGILLIAVADTSGLLVSSPTIEVRDPDTNDLLNSATPFEGQHYFSLPSGSYKVVVSKSGFNSERTYGSDEITTPLNPHLNVIDLELTQKTFVIDQSASFSVETLSVIDEETFPVPNVTFNLKGQKIIGTDINDQPVYKYLADHTTNSQGVVGVYNLEWDNYEFSVVSPSNLSLVDIVPSPQPIALDPGDAMNVQLFVSAENTLLVTVKEQDTSDPVFSASVRLFNGGYDETSFTDSNGQILFIPLESGDYDLEVSAGQSYSSFSTSVSVFGNTFMDIDLDRIE